MPHIQIILCSRATNYTHTYRQCLAARLAKTFNSTIYYEIQQHQLLTFVNRYSDTIKQQPLKLTSEIKQP